ncbi:MAG: alpha/beta hydrolase family protein [Chitinophagaceae bacterium]
MQKSFKCVVIKPTVSQRKAISLPVVYLLHGYSGNYSNWITKVPALKEYADQYRIMIVCPDGGFSSWYLDSPVDSTMRFDTYIAKEVPAYIDTHYHTIANRNGRAITGLSMGGHGGLLLSFLHPDIFGACGSMSGGVDLNNVHTRFDVIKRVGDTITHAADWNKYSVINMVDIYKQHLLSGNKNDSLAILFDCGTEDIFFTENHALHEKMRRLNIPHDYIERPGHHDWLYWGNAVGFEMMFFSTYFKREAISH